jgi:hypothetical protein
MKILQKNTDLLKKYDKNAKKHDKKQIEQVAESIQRFGFVQPIVIDKNNEIIIGHCRYEASVLLGLSDVPCVLVDNLTDEEIKALRLADNKLNESVWNMVLVEAEFVSLSEKMQGLTGFNFDDFKDVDFENIKSNENRQIAEKQITITCPHCEESFKYNL